MRRMDPCGVKGDAIAGAVEETNAEVVFQRSDLERNSRLGEKKMFGGLAKIQMFGNRAKYLETEILQLRHGMIIHCGVKAREFPIELLGTAFDFRRRTGGSTESAG